MRRWPWWTVAACLAVAACLDSHPVRATEKVDFNKKIRPIFKERCYECHGPQKQESGLRLDRRQEALAGGDSGVAIVPGDSEDGLLLKYVQSEDGEQVMPPKGDRLTDEEIQLLKKWIEDGASWPDEKTSIAGKSSIFRIGLQSSKRQEEGTGTLIDPNIR